MPFKILYKKAFYYTKENFYFNRDFIGGGSTDEYGLT